MNVKISVKKLFNMEQLIISLKDGQKRYRDQIGDMFNANEDLKEKMAEANASLTRMDERIRAYQQEIEDLRNHTDDNAAYLHTLCKDQSDEINAFDEQCEALKLEVEDLKKERKEILESWRWSEDNAEINELKKDRKDWEDAARSAADNL